MKRYFGQNFLMNKSIINSIVEAIGIERNDFLLKIGPGKGDLTDVINFNFGDQINFTIVEKDADLIPFLLERYSKDDVRVVNNDFLKFDLNSYLMKPNILFGVFSEASPNKLYDANDYVRFLSKS